MTITLSRRDFLKVTGAAGGGLAVAVSLPGTATAQGAAQAPAEVTAWVVIKPDDTTIIRVARSEMGQGSLTGLPMLVAEELECDWSKVKAEYASPKEHLKRNRVWGNMGTGGSRSTRESQEFLRRAGATCREMLVTAAAQRWSVPASECVAASSVVTHTPTGRKLRYGQLAAAAAKVEPPKNPKMKDPKDWKLIGQSVKRIDLAEKVTGQPIYASDVRLPGMVHAAIQQSPVFGGKVKSVDDAAALKMRGVQKVIRLDDAVVAIADNWWRANNAVKAVKVEWDEGANGNVSSESIMDFLKTGLAQENAPVARNMGDSNAAFAGAAKTVEAEYFAPFLNHATMEPQNCVAQIKGDQVEVWVGTQNAEASLAVAASAAGVPLANVEVHKLTLGGGFGRRGAFQDFVRQAVLVAKETGGRPVKLQWSREEDMQHGFYRPVTLVRMKAALDASGKCVAMDTRVSSQSILTSVRPEEVKNGIDPQAVGVFSDSPYDIPNQKVDFALRNTHVPSGFWRAVFHSQNPFFRECFIDEVAAAAGKDPLAFRRELLVNSKDRMAPKYVGVLDAVAKAANWGAPLPAGVHRGIAVMDGYGSYAAAVIEASVSPAGEVSVKRVVVSTDPGYVLNRDQAIAQVESNVVYGLSAALWGENRIRNGRVVESNFHDYPVMLMKDMPKVETVLVPSGGFWGGMGEPPLGPLAPALVNAVFAATGKRIRSLPLKNHDLKKA